jgi:hypothetical protein
MSNAFVTSTHLQNSSTTKVCSLYRRERKEMSIAKGQALQKLVIYCLLAKLWFVTTAIEKLNSFTIYRWRKPVSGDEVYLFQATRGETLDGRVQKDSPLKAQEWTERREAG